MVCLKNEVRLKFKNTNERVSLSKDYSFSLLNDGICEHNLKEEDGKKIQMYCATNTFWFLSEEDVFMVHPELYCTNH